MFYKTIINFIISLGVAIATWFLASKTVPQIATILSIVIFFITELFLMIRDLLSSWETVRSRMSDIQTKTEDALGLWKVAASDPCLNKSIHEILADYEAIQKENDPFFLKQMQDKINATKETIHKMSLKEIKDRPMEETNLRYIKHLFEIADTDTRILSTTYGESAEWWETPEGHQYWQYNVKALERGVKIERIFIIDDKEGLRRDPKLMKLMEKHLANKPPFSVRIATTDQENEKLTKNMIIFKNKNLPSYVVWIEPSTDKLIDKWNLSGILRVVQLYENIYSMIRNSSEACNVVKKDIFNP